MAIFNIILGNMPFIFHSFLGQKIYCDSLLQKGISDVFFVLKYLLN